MGNKSHVSLTHNCLDFDFGHCLCWLARPLLFLLRHDVAACLLQNEDGVCEVAYAERSSILFVAGIVSIGSVEDYGPVVLDVAFSVLAFVAPE